MSNTDKLREIVDKTFPLFGSRLDEWRKVERDNLLSDLTALISEHYYPKEFIVFVNDNFYWDKGLGGYLPTTIIHQGMTFKTTDELLTYWEGVK